MPGNYGKNAKVRIFYIGELFYYFATMIKIDLKNNIIIDIFENNIIIYQRNIFLRLQTQIFFNNRQRTRYYDIKHLLVSIFGQKSKIPSVYKFLDKFCKILQSNGSADGTCWIWKSSKSPTVAEYWPMTRNTLRKWPRNGSNLKIRPSWIWIAGGGSGAGIISRNARKKKPISRWPK